MSRHLREKTLLGTLIALYFLSHPLLQILASLSGFRFLNFGVPPWKNFYIYGLASPLVGYLLWVRHPRARFALYIFLTLDLWRALKGHHRLLIALDLAILLSFQLPLMRRIYPSVTPEAVKARMQARLNRLRSLIGRVKI